jgi:hypothetical protein
MGLLDKNNPAEDFYEKKHLNSDLICCNFTELSDEEFYECLRWANTTLMKNYYDKQRNSTIAQIDYLYREKDVTFRGFRHHTGGSKQAGTGEQFNKKTQEISSNGKNIKNDKSDEAPAVNWENSSFDGDRFSQPLNGNSDNNKSLKSFENYLKKKETRFKNRKKKNNLSETSSIYTNWH